MFHSLSTLGNIVAETFENCYVSSNVSQFVDSGKHCLRKHLWIAGFPRMFVSSLVDPGKHCWGYIWELLCFLECFAVCLPWETLSAETFENCYVSTNVSPVCRPWKTLLRKHLRIALASSACFPVCQPCKTLLRKHLRIARVILECFPVCPPWETLL